MKKISLLIIIIALLFANCTAPMKGLLFHVTEQHVYSYGGSQVNSGKIEKSGKSCSYSSQWLFVWLFFYGAGGSADQARKNGGLKSVSVIDRSSINILLGLFHGECTVVWGE